MNEEFKAHKAILASQSPVFRKMLEADMKEKRLGIIEISDPDIKPAVISDLLAYLYTGTAPKMDKLEVVKDLLNVANKYELSHLFAMCENRLNSEINVSSVVDLLVLADLYNATHLKKACLNFLLSHSDEVYQTDSWKQLKKNCEGHASLLLQIVESTP